jgi:adenylosuccinate synthase
MVDLLDVETFRERLFRNVEEKNFLLTQFFKEDPVDGEAIFKEYSEFAERLKPYIANTSLIIDEELKKGRRILFEGAQGSHLDIDHGTYPFVTSSSTVAGSACCGTGFGPTQIHSVVGIIKAYTTRVGGGPFVTELTDDIGDRIQKVGHEYGATTGRRRRCGWLDMVMIRQSVRLSGISGFALTKLDVLSGIEKIKICTGYKYKDEIIKDAVPSDLKILARCEPIYEELDGWTEDITTARELASLPANTRKYLDRISQLSGVEIYLVSVGSGREETIVLKNPLRGV